DPDAWRTALRQAVAAGDLPAVARMVADERAAKLPTPSLILLRPALERTPELARVTALLVRVQRDRPNDFWVNMELGRCHAAAQPPDWDEGLRSFSIALALWPDSPAAHEMVGVCLDGKERSAEAEWHYREAIRLKPDLALGFSKLGKLLAQGRVAEAE